MRIFRFAKTFLILSLIFALCFNTALAYDFSVDNQNEINETFADENAPFLKLLSKLGIYTAEYEGDKVLASDKANDILKVIFALSEDVLAKDGDLTNQSLINALVKALELKTSIKLNKIFDYEDFGFIDAKYRYSYEAYLNSFDIEKPHLNPNKILTEKDFFKIVSSNLNFIVNRHGFEILESKVSEVSLYNNIKTISLSNNDNVIVKRSDKLLFIGDEISKGSKAYLYIKDKKVYAVRGETVLKNYKSGYIYKGKVYLYDSADSIIIFDGIKKYTNSAFNDYINGFYEFDAFSNLLVFDNFNSVEKDKINTHFLDKEVVFFTMIDENNTEKICYIIYGGN